MDLTQVKYETVEDGKIAVVSLNRPEYRNAQSRRLLEEMDEAFQTASRDPQVRVIILRGEGPHFSAGHDLGTPQEVADRQERPYPPGLYGRLMRSSDLYAEFGLRWRGILKPTICAIQGFCINGGWMIASPMDVIIASDDAQFRVGKGQYFSLPWDIGLRKTREYLFENRFLSAQELADWGFVSRVVPRERLAEEVMAYARRVAQQSVYSLRLTKMAILQAEDLQGFSNHIRASHNIFMLGSAGSNGEAQDRNRAGGRRRVSVVQDALDYTYGKGH